MVAQTRRAILEFRAAQLHIDDNLCPRLCVRRYSDPHTVKYEHEAKLAGVLGVAPPQAYERGADRKRSWWRRALDLFGTFKRKHGEVLTREDVAEHRNQKAREALSVTDPERHLGLRVSRLEDLAKGLVVDGDVELNDLGENFELKEDEYGAEPNTGYSIVSLSDARNHERPNHLRLFQEGWEPRSFRDRQEDDGHIALVRDMERRNKQATQEFLSRWNEAEKEARARRKTRRGRTEHFFAKSGEIRSTKRDRK
jgi:hypothetical protein